MSFRIALTPPLLPRVRGGGVSASGSLAWPRIRGKAPAKKPVVTSISRSFTFCQCRQASRQNDDASKSGRFRLFRSPSLSLRVGSCTARTTDKRRLRRVALRRNTPSAPARIPRSEAESPKASSMRGANSSRRIGRGASPRRPLSHDCRDFVRTVISFFRALIF